MSDDARSNQIRPARTADAEVAAVLLYSAYTHSQVTFPLQDDAERGFIDRLEHYFREEGNRFSYRNVEVAVHDSEVVGLVLSFGGRDEPRLNAAVGSWLTREAADDEWYLDALAVLKDWGRHRIGTRLLETAEREARRRGYAKIALNVAEGNTPAIALYTRQGFVAVRQTVLYQRPHLRMVKTLENAR
jgi:ribosomal protein S18 acetylase RimI-like enzyme